MLAFNEEALFQMGTIKKLSWKGGKNGNKETNNKTFKHFVLSLQPRFIKKFYIP